MKTQSQTIRLDKFLANAGVLSRRAIKQFLKQENVTINDQRITESGTRLNLQNDVVKINGERINKPSFVYFLLNKPIGFISTTADEMFRESVIDLIDTDQRIYPVGRLDKDTHGLLLLTNDGELTHKLTHPRYHVPKVYKLIVQGKPRQSQLKALRTGVLLDDGITLPAEVVVKQETDEQTTMLITLHEGRNRQIRRMCETVGLELVDLERVSFGPLKLQGIKVGEYRELTKEELKKLREAVEIS